MDTGSDILEGLASDVKIEDNSNIEFIECQKCGEYNILKKTVQRRRSKRVRHIRLDDIVFASLKRYAIVNDVDMNYAIMLLLHNARTKNISYLVNEKHLVSKSKRNGLMNNRNE